MLNYSSLSKPEFLEQCSGNNLLSTSTKKEITEYAEKIPDPQTQQINEFQKRVNPLISIIMASNRPDKLRAFFDNIIYYTKNLKAIEILVVVDHNDNNILQIIDEYKEKLYIKVYYYTNTYGMYLLHHTYKNCFNDINPNSYFVVNFNDEVRIKTHGWDQNLSKYIGYFKDNIFRIKISDKKFKTSYNIQDALFFPDHFSIITVKSLKIANSFDVFWGHDSVMQLIFYYLEKINDNYLFYRSISANDIELEPVITGKDVDPNLYKDSLIRSALKLMHSIKAQSYFYIQALKLYNYIANQNHFDLSNDSYIKFRLKLFIRYLLRRYFDSSSIMFLKKIIKPIFIRPNVKLHKNSIIASYNISLINNKMAEYEKNLAKILNNKLLKIVKFYIR